VDDQRNLTGVFTTVAREVLTKKLGVKEIQPVLIQWASLIPGLQAGRYDFILAGMFITPQRCKEVVFTEPFRCTTDVFVTRKDTKFEAKSYAELAKLTDLKVGAVAGGTQVANATGNGMPEGKIQFFPDPLAGVDALKTRRIDVWMGPTAGIKAIFALPNFDSSGLNTVSFVPEVKGKQVLGCGGFAFRRGDTEILDIFNEFIIEGKKNGSLYDLVKEWVPRDEFDAARNVQASGLCTE
jgi:polar amino acid transport system substrate-binding protein